MADNGVIPSFIKGGETDTLVDVGATFDRAPLRQPLFLNSVPKSGTHLIRNIMRMFVPEAQQYHGDYIQAPNLRLHMAAFRAQPPFVSWGHLLFDDYSVLALQQVRHILLVRDPYDWVLARARFFLSDEFNGNLNNIKGGAVSMEEALNMMILGVHQKQPSLLDVYTHNAVAWSGTKAIIIRYEDLAAAANDLQSRAAERFFTQLLDNCGVETPPDWRARVEAGADRRLSRTARENLNIGVEIPDVLPDAQKRLVDFCAPGLRTLLGYS
ncbi:MAG: hypothetical protein JSR86_16620 [Proteobacteria bacterium]|nr:hypothetical protein [Pseudomonadota bacterium]